MESNLKLPSTAQRFSVRVTIGVSRINDNGEIVNYLPIGFDIKTALNELAMLGYRYYCSLHNQDGDYIHYHLVLVSSVLRRCKTYINNVAECFGCENVNVQVLDIGDFVLAVQYLVHINDFDKYQYDRSIILTNDTLKHLNEILDSKVSYSETYTMSDIQRICRQCVSYDEVLNSFSLQFVKQNLALINSLCRCYGKL